MRALVALVDAGSAAGMVAVVESALARVDTVCRDPWRAMGARVRAAIALERAGVACPASMFSVTTEGRPPELGLALAVTAVDLSLRRGHIDDDAAARCAAAASAVSRGPLSRLAYGLLARYHVLAIVSCLTRGRSVLPPCASADVDDDRDFIHAHLAALAMACEVLGTSFERPGEPDSAVGLEWLSAPDITALAESLRLAAALRFGPKMIPARGGLGAVPGGLGAAGLGVELLKRQVCAYMHIQACEVEQYARTVRTGCEAVDAALAACARREASAEDLARGEVAQLFLPAWHCLIAQGALAAEAPGPLDRHLRAALAAPAAAVDLVAWCEVQLAGAGAPTGAALGVMDDALARLPEAHALVRLSLEVHRLVTSLRTEHGSPTLARSAQKLLAQILDELPTVAESVVHNQTFAELCQNSACTALNAMALAALGTALADEGSLGGRDEGSGANCERLRAIFSAAYVLSRRLRAAHAICYCVHMLARVFREGLGDEAQALKLEEYGRRKAGECAEAINKARPQLELLWGWTGADGLPVPVAQ